MFIAGRIKSNIRSSKGRSSASIAYASLTGRDISLDLTQEVLRDAIDLDTRAITIESIQKYVADYYQMKVHELKSRNNSKSIALPAGRDVFVQAAHDGVAAGDWPQLRRQTPLDRAALHPEGPAAAQARRFRQPDRGFVEGIR
jgi:hypothetical protein